MPTKQSSPKFVLAKKLLRWYSTRQRSLPWRERPRPYAVWVAEVMAQQTRLQTMLPYYRRWMRRFPSIKSLAASNEQDVLAIWEGLGYYSRARNLRRAAQDIRDRFGGKLPEDVDSLLTLPGIGRYTAGAIASIAFGKDKPAVDGNAIRVLTRIFVLRQSVGDPKLTKQVWALAASHLPSGRAADYNQALMDLGASVCTPRNPQCTLCPLKSGCRAFRLGIQERLPTRSKSTRIPVRHSAAVVLHTNGRVLVLQRPSGGLLVGMWEFPSIPLESTRRAKLALKIGLRKKLGFQVAQLQDLGQLDHTYSHFKSQVAVFSARLNSSKPEIKSDVPYRWITLSDLANLPMGKLDRRIALSLRDNTKRGKR